MFTGLADRTITIVYHSPLLNHSLVKNWLQIAINSAIGPLSISTSTSVCWPKEYSSPLRTDTFPFLSTNHQHTHGRGKFLKDRTYLPEIQPHQIQPPLNHFLPYALQLQKTQIGSLRHVPSTICFFVYLASAVSSHGIAPIHPRHSFAGSPMLFPTPVVTTNYVNPKVFYRRTSSNPIVYTSPPLPPPHFPLRLYWVPVVLANRR